MLEGIKEPSFEQTFGITGTFPTLPNPNLQPEQNRAIEAGVLQSLFNNRLSLSAVYFHNQFRDQIEYEYNSDHQHQPVCKLQSRDGAGRRSGAERPCCQPSVRDRRLHLHLNPDSTGAALRSRMPDAIRASTVLALRCCAALNKLACCC